MRDATVETVYSSHFLEHVRRADALRFLRECHRILRPGGVLRLVVPDLRRLAERYVGSRPGPRLSADEFVAATLLAEPVRPRVASATLSALWDRAGHLWMYDVESLCALVREAGFAAPRECSFRTGEAPDLERLDLADREHESIYVEARR
jgi:SAM-dependent methyltransferase